MLNGRKEQSMGRITKCYRRETKQEQGILRNSGKLLLVPYTKDFGIITRF